MNDSAVPQLPGMPGVSKFFYSYCGVLMTTIGMGMLASKKFQQWTRKAERHERFDAGDATESRRTPDSRNEDYSTGMSQRTSQEQPRASVEPMTSALPNLDWNRQSRLDRTRRVYQHRLKL